VSGSSTTTRIPLLERDQVTPEVANVYDALLKARGVVPNMFKTLAHTPALALATAGYLKALLSDGALTGWYKELIATRMSVLNGSEYAVRAHALSARQKGASEDQIAAVKSDFEQGPFTQHGKAWVAMCRKDSSLRPRFG
jgi:AhpD family alkylhydroperoxidase